MSHVYRLAACFLLSYDKPGWVALMACGTLWAANFLERREYEREA